ncbi:MAG TPA: MFS transporter [Aliidongia sp.]|uniref:MFS transporter n=1 Tax=Aliidongia sp. TaxID=1914230 RepID=UPI002DDD063C|nr:MFS transporter [Aliidongia sp.]HEV2675816.1 MFS transporter [Aliidongia sp.]
MSAPVDRKDKIMSVIRVSSGNFLEMYDFFIFAYVAKQIGDTFFPGGSDFIKLMAAFSTFAVGFMMRPLGAIILGSYIDHVGRRKGLILTLSMMSLGTLSLAVTPGYETIGIAAPVIIVLGRLLQGFSAGVELGGVSVYLSEIATPGNKGFYVAWQSGSQQVAVILAALLGILLNYYLPADMMKSWGWRIPLFVGCLIIPFIFVLRASLKETEEFLTRKRRPTLAEIYRTTFANFGLVLCGMLMVLTTTVLFYFITAYTPTFGKEVLKLTALDALTVTLCVAVSNLFWLPVIGALTDRIGRTPVLIFCTVLTLASAYPALTWLISSPSFVNLMIVELWLSFLYGAYNGAMVVYLTEIMPAEVRTAGFSLAYSLATVFGGLTPGIATWLIHETDNRASAGWWLSIAAALSLVAVLLAVGFKFAHRAAVAAKAA